jgi:hypothetical protein
LDDNAVGYVALAESASPSAEARVISAQSEGGYLHEIWRSTQWRLYAVQQPTPIVAAPAVLEASTQSAMTVRVPCACDTSVRIRWSKFLAVVPKVSVRTPDMVEDSYRATLVEDGAGWTVLTTSRPGTYVLAGS